LNYLMQQIRRGITMTKHMMVQIFFFVFFKYSLNLSAHIVQLNPTPGVSQELLGFDMMDPLWLGIRVRDIEYKNLV